MKTDFATARPAEADVLAFIVTKSSFAGFEFPLEKAQMVHDTANSRGSTAARGRVFC